MMVAQRTVDLDRVQILRKAVLLMLVASSTGFLVVGASRWAGAIHESIEWIGIGLIVLCIAGRTWCSLYIAGHKVRKLVTHGPYSVTRNPLYVFSILGAAGAGAQLGSIVLSVAVGVLAAAVFYVVVRLEERALATRIGLPYLHYFSAVPRFRPRWRLWKDAEKVEAHPGLILRTFGDACIFLLSIPLAEGFEYLHEIGMLPALLTLP